MVASISMPKESNMLGLHFLQGTVWTIEVPLFYGEMVSMTFRKRSARDFSRVSSNDIFRSKSVKQKFRVTRF